MELTPEVIAARDRQAREWCANPHAFFKAFSRTARRFQHMNQSPRYRVMTLVGEAGDFLPLRPLRLQVLGRAMRVSSWEQVFSCTSMPYLCVAAEFGEDLQAPLSPSVHHALAGATLIVNLAATPAIVGKAAAIRSRVAEQSAIIALQASPKHTGTRFLVRLARVNLQNAECL